MYHSFSSVNMYKKCPMKYFLSKIDSNYKKLPSANLWWVLGECIHTVLEDLYSNYVRNYLKPDVKNFLDSFKDLWEKEINRIEQEYDRNPFDKLTLDWYYNRWIEYIKNYFNKYAPFDQDWKPFEMEYNINFEFPEWLKFNWKIDRIDIKWDSLIINDYKTTLHFPWDLDLSQEDQINLYAIWVKQKWWQTYKKFLGKIIYLNFIQDEWEKRTWEHCREITDEKIETTKQEYLSIMNEIEKNRLIYEREKINKFKVNPWYYCDGCECKSWCPLFNNLYMDWNEVLASELWDKTVNNLIEEFAIVNEKIKNLEMEKSLIWSTLIDYAKLHWTMRLYWETKKINITERTTYKIDSQHIEDVENSLKQDDVLNEVLSIDSNKLWKKFKDETLDYKNYDEWISKKETTYIHSVVNKKEKEMWLDITWEEC